MNGHTTSTPFWPLGYRVRSPRGVQFRRWASMVLKEHLVKGFVMDDERLKNPDGRPVWLSGDRLCQEAYAVNESHRYPQLWQSRHIAHHARHRAVAHHGGGVGHVGCQVAVHVVRGHIFAQQRMHGFQCSRTL